MRHVPLAALLIAGLSAAEASAQTAPAARTLTLSFAGDGSVNLKAQNVTVRDILAEWARQCGCYIVNAQNLTGGPLAMPIEFQQAPQARVLDSLLRQAAGYTLTPQRAGSRSVSQFETIYIVATSTPVQGPSYTPAPAQPLIPGFMGSPDDEIPPIVPTTLRPDLNGARPPVPGQGPQQQPLPQPSQQSAPAAPRSPGTPGVFVPIVPVGSQPQGPTPGSVVPTTPQLPVGGR